MTATMREGRATVSQITRTWLAFIILTISTSPAGH
ncbi:hypothetical protein ABIB56_002871 [Glaciihabitans sp. UYNi722]